MRRMKLIFFCFCFSEAKTLLFFMTFAQDKWSQSKQKLGNFFHSARNSEKASFSCSLLPMLWTKNEKFLYCLLEIRIPPYRKDRSEQFVFNLSRMQSVSSATATTTKVQQL
jgi:hypothetical protein